MFARISAKLLFLAAGAACVFFGVGLLGLALASALTATLGVAGAYALTGTILLVPVVLWGLVKTMSRPAPPAPPPPSGILAALITAVAKETPWVAVIGAGLGSAAEMFLNRNRSKPKK
jgi:uncharacterized membrane protein